MSTVLTGYYNDKFDLDYISKYMINLSQSKKTAFHVWCNDSDKTTIDIINKVRNNKILYDALKNKFPNMKIKNISEVDEIYYAISPSLASGSNRLLVDCHYDAPFRFMPNNKILFYRIIVACNENKDVETSFPNDNIKVIMNTGDFHGLSYNDDMHCVVGAIPKSKHRILLKLHYMLIPNEYDDNTFYEKFIKYINIKWTIFSRNIMNSSTDSNTISSKIVNTSRYLYNNIYLVIFIVFILVFIKYYRLRLF